MDIVQSAPHDVLLRNGWVIGPNQGLDGIFDVAARAGRRFDADAVILLNPLLADAA